MGGHKGRLNIMKIQIHIPDPIEYSAKTRAKVRQILDKNSVFGVDTETTGRSVSEKLSPMVDKLICFSISTTKDRVYIEAKYLNEFKAFLASNKIKIFHNIHYDRHVFLNHNIDLGGEIYDTMIMYWLLNEDPPHGLDYCAEKHLGITKKSYKKAFPKTTLAESPKSIVEEYATLDAYATCLLYYVYKEMLKAKPWQESTSMWDFYLQIEKPFQEMLFDIERRGMKVDIAHFKVIQQQAEKRLSEIEGQIFKEAGKLINLRSRPQLGELLFDTYKLPVLRKTKGGMNRPQRATDKKTLQRLKLQGHDKYVDPLLEYSKLDTIRKMFVEKIIPGVEAVGDGRLHTTFGLTVTGRLSSSKPNVMNFPRPGQDPLGIRKGIIAEPGNLIISADIAQAEMGLLGHFSGDDKLLAAYLTDIYTESGKWILDKEEITKDDRAVMKIVCLAVSYGMGAETLQENLLLLLGVKRTLSECSDLLKKFYKVYHILKDNYMDMMPFICRSKKPPHLRTLLGRYRHLPHINSSDYSRRSYAERESTNIGPQGGVADIMRASMLSISKNAFLLDHNCRLISQIHDEVLLETKAENAEKCIPVIVDILEHALDPYGIKLDVQLKAEAACGFSWPKA